MANYEMRIKLKSERELLVNFVHRVWVWELGRKERVLRQQETLTSFKTGDERSVRHWSPDKRFPNERRQHRTSFPPLVRTIANGSNLGRVWRREAKLGIGYKARRRRGGRIRKRVAFHVPPWHQGLSRSRGANKPKNVQNGTRTFCVGAKMLQSEYRVVWRDFPVSHNIWYSNSTIWYINIEPWVLAGAEKYIKTIQGRLWNWLLRLGKGQRSVSVTSVGLRWPLVCHLLLHPRLAFH